MFLPGLHESEASQPTSTPSAHGGGRRRIILPLLILILLILDVIVFRDQWRGRTSFTFDFPEGYYGTVAYWISSVQSWQWPQWIPYQSMGYPLLMNPQMGLFYPPFWLFVLLRIPYTLHAANIFQTLHVWFGSVGVLLLAIRLFRSQAVAMCGAVAFLFFGGFYTNSEHADIIRGFAWIPWLLWAGLLDGETRTVRLRDFHFETSLGARTLAIPAIVACLVTGAYTGQVIAGLLLFGVFVATQAAQRYVHTKNRILFGDLGLQFAAVGLGVLMCAAFLIPGLYLSHELTRAQGVGGIPTWYMTSKSFFDLIFPSDLVHPAPLDYSMHGMQLPIALWVFVALARPKHLRTLLPFLAIAAVAALMAFAVFLPLSGPIRATIPMVGLSRFPPGDYREFIYLAVLLAALAGLSTAFEDREAAWKKTALALVVLVLFGVACFTFIQHDLEVKSLQPFLRLAKGTLWVGFGAVAALHLARLYRKPWLLGIAIPLLTFAAMLPVISEMHGYWNDPDVLKNFYDGKQFPLTVNGELRTLAIFKRHEPSRPPRQTAGNRDWMSWRGYLDGVYMTDDPGGAVSLSRAHVERDPALSAFIQQGSRIVALDCGVNPAACAANPEGIAIAKAPDAGRAVEYGRERIVYEVEAPARSLMVENEIFIAGWRATCDGEPIEVQRVDGSLRGWVTPPGRHRVQLSYATPWLRPSLAVSFLAGFCWLACVILISSDRTGG